MPDINFNILDGLSFGERNAATEQLLDVTFTARYGVLASRRKHVELFDAGTALRRLLSHTPHDAIYALSEAGEWFKDAVSLDTGFNTSEGTLLAMLPNVEQATQQVFIAGGAKMRKYDGTTITNWGIAAPADAAPAAVSVGFVATELINDCDDATDWTAVGCSVADEPTIKQQGTNSLKVELTADVAASITDTFAAPIDLRLTDVISFFIRIGDPASLSRFTVSFDLNNDGFINDVAYRNWAMEYSPENPPPVAEVVNATNPQESSGDDSTELVDRRMTRISLLPSTPDEWKHIAVGRETFRINSASTWQNVYAIKIDLLSSLTQDIYIDIIYGTVPAQDDAQGARYRYGYEASATGNRSNLNLTPTEPIRGENTSININAFAQPADAQVTHIVVFRDTGGNGVFQFVGRVAVPNPWAGGPTFVDSVPVEDLGEVDLEDNAPPPSATLAIQHAGYVWLNDISNTRRLWRCVAGRYESFSLDESSGFFDLGTAGDSIVGFGVVNGVLNVFTQQSIIAVVSPGIAPAFRKVRDIGPTNGRALVTTRDFAVFSHWTGLYLFDGANVTPMPKINALFNPESVDDRRITTANADTIVLGADNAHIWLSYTQLDSTAKQYTYAIDIKRWVEESVVLTAHDSNDDTFYHIAASAAGLVLSIYADTEFESLIIRTDVAELGSIGHVTEFMIESISENADLTVTPIVDEVPLANETLAAHADRRHQFIQIADQLGERCDLRIVASADELVEIYSIRGSYTSLPDTTHYRSEPILLSNDLVSVIEYDMHLIGLEDGDLIVQLKVDGVLAEPITVAMQRNVLATRRDVIYPLVGKLAELDISGSRFSIRALALSVVQLSNGEAKYVAIPTGAR